MPIAPDLLATLVAVIDAGTFDAAARSLRVTPSAVSQRVKALERQVGRVLVVRSKPVRATAAAAALVRLGREQALLEREALESLGLAGGDPVTVSIAVNADSLETWLLPPLARAAAAHPIAVELHRADQDRTAGLLSSGVAMAAVTSQRSAVPGCISSPLGAMRYRPVASRAFVERWLPDGPSPAALAVAPIVEFDRDDDLQRRYLRRITRRDAHPPRHVVPASAEFARAVSLGLGWGMLPEAQIARFRDRLVELDPGDPIGVRLYWQQWDLRSPLLDAVAAEVRAEAVAALA